MPPTKSLLSEMVVWYFYAEEEMDPLIQSKIRKRFAQLGIPAQHSIVTSPYHLQYIIESEQWSQSAFNKIVIFDFAEKKERIKKKIKKNNPDYKSWIQLKQIQEIQRLLEKEVQKVQIVIYKQFNYLQAYIDQALRQMQVVTKKDFLEELMLLNQEKWKDAFAFILKFYSCLNEQHLNPNSNLEKQQINWYLKDYCNNISFQNYLKESQKSLHVKGHCEKIGRQIKDIYSSVKKDYLKNHEYFKTDKVIGWSLMITNGQEISFKKNQNLYLHKTFGMYYSSFKQMMKQEHPSPEMNLVALKMMMDSKVIDQKDSEFNHGFTIVNSKIVINSLNIFKLVKIKPVIYTVSSEKQGECQKDSEQLSINYKITLLQFQLISFNDLTNQNMYPQQESYSNNIKNIFKFIKNYLQKHHYKISLENAYVENNQFQFAAEVITKKKKSKVAFDQKIIDNIGKQKQRANKKFDNEQQYDNILKMGKLYKNLQDWQSYLFCLQKYIAKIQNQRNISQISPFERYIRKGKVLLEISLIIGLSSRGQVVLFINKIQEVRKIIKYLGPILSRQVEKQYKKQIKEDKQNSCFLGLCEGNQSEDQQYIIRQYDWDLAELFFRQRNSRKAQQVRKLKFEFVFLFKEYKKTVIQLYCYGDRNDELKDIKDQIRQLQVYASKVKERTKLFEKRNRAEIKVLQKQFQEHHSKMKQLWSAISQIKNFPLKKLGQTAKRNLAFIDSAHQLVDWESTSRNLQKMVTLIKQEQQSFYREHQHTQSIIQQSQDYTFQTQKHKTAKEYILFLQQDHYSNNSIQILNIYKKQVEGAFRLKNIEEIQQISKIHFPLQKRNSNIFKADTYHKLAILYYQSERQQKCIWSIQSSLRYYKKGKANVPKIFLDLDLLKMQAMVKQVTKHLHLNFYLDCEIQLGTLQYQIKQLRANWVQQFENYKKLEVYRIQLELLSVQIQELQIDSNKYQIIADRYKSIQKRKRQFCDQTSISSIMMYVDIMRLLYQANKMSQCKQYYEKILRAFQQPLKSEQKIIKQYGWAKNLALFFQQQEKQLEYIDILPARKFIERSLFDFKEINNGKLSFQLQRYYRIVYQIYQKFMKQKLRHFLLVPNILQVDQHQQAFEVDFSSEKSEDSNRNKHFDDINWILFFSQKQISEAEELKKIYAQKYSQHIYFDLISLKRGIDMLKANFKIKLGMCMEDFLLLLHSQNNEDILTMDNIDTIKIVASLDNNTSNQVTIYLQRERVNFKIDIVSTIEDIIKEVSYQETQSQTFKIYPNVLFYKQGFQEKINQYHAVAYSGLIEKIDAESAEKSFKKLMLNFLNQRTRESENDNNLENEMERLQTNKLIAEKYLATGLQLRKQRMNIYSGNQQTNKDQIQLKRHCRQIIDCYKKQSNFYYFANNMIRSISQDIDFDFIGLQSLIYPLYYSIKSLYNYQLKEQKMKFKQKVILWRIAQMKNSQFKIFYNEQINRPFIQFTSFLSTTKSFSWVIERLIKIFRKQRNFQRFVIFSIEVDSTQEFLLSPTNNGFCQFEKDSEEQILFNLFNIFQLQSASLKRIESIQRIYQQKLKKSVNEWQFLEISQAQIRFISLKIGDFQHIVKEKLSKKNCHYKMFQNVQASFLKQRNKFQTTQNKITASRFGIIDAYQALGRLSQAVQYILNQLSKNEYSTLQEDNQNLIIRAIKNCIKMGQIQKASQISKQLQKFQDKKKEVYIYSERKKLQEQIYRAKLSSIKLLMQQKLDVEKSHQEIVLLQNELRKTICNDQYERLSKKAKEVSLKFYQTTNLFGIQDIDDGINALDEYLDELRETAVSLKESNHQLKDEKVQLYCSTLLTEMKESIIQNRKSLNRKYSRDIDRLEDKLMKVSGEFNYLSMENEFQSNAFLCEYASTCISNDFKDDFLQEKSVCEELSILIEIQSTIDEEESRRIQEPQRTKQIIKEASFQLLGKLQTKQSEIRNTCMRGMEEMMDKYSEMINKMIDTQIKYLRQEGHQRSSPLLLRKYNKIIKNRLRRSQINFQEVSNILQENLPYCENKEIEKCRFLVLAAEIQFLQVQKQLIETQYENIKDKDLYKKAQKYLLEARNSLSNAYQVQRQKSAWSRFVNRFRPYTSKNQKKMEYSDQNLQILVLELKIKHSKFRITEKENKEELLLALQNLGNLVNNSKANFNVLNEEIFVYEIYSIYALCFPRHFGFKQTDFEIYFKQFTLSLQKRKILKGQKNIQNSESCLQLFQLLNTNLRQRISHKNYSILERYIDIGAWNCQNNSLFWRFVICNFNKIKISSSKVQYVLKKLNYILQVLKILQRNKVRQNSVNRIEKVFILFNKNYIHRNRIEQNQVLQLIGKINMCFGAIKNSKPSESIIKPKNQQKDRLNDYFEQQQIQHFTPAQNTEKVDVPTESTKVVTKQQDAMVSSFVLSENESNQIGNEYQNLSPAFMQQSQRNLIKLKKLQVRSKTNQLDKKKNSANPPVNPLSKQYRMNSSQIELNYKMDTEKQQLFIEEYD